MILNKNSPKYRELLWKACLVHGDPAEEPFVVCNLCHLPVDPDQDWDESHSGIPAALGGFTVGIAHRRCNMRDAYHNVIPMVAKAKRQYRKHRGIVRPGLGKHALPAGRNTGFKKTMRGEVVKRAKRGEKHRELMAALGRPVS